LSLRTAFFWRAIIVCVFALVVLLGLAVGVKAGQTANHLATKIGVVEVKACVTVKIVEIWREIGVVVVHVAWTLEDGGAAHCAGCGVLKVGGRVIGNPGIADGRFCAGIPCRLRIESGEEEILLVGREVWIEFLG
jgi:hypothetical protein